MGRTDPREMPVPAPRAIRTSVTDNSRMGPSSPVRAPFAQVFWRRSRPTTSAGRTRRLKAHLKLFSTFGCAYPPPHPGLAHALRGQRNIHPPFFARAGGQSGAAPPGSLLGQVLRRVCRGWGEQGEVQGLRGTCLRGTGPRSGFVRGLVPPGPLSGPQPCIRGSSCAGRGDGSFEPGMAVRIGRGGGRERSGGGARRHMHVGMDTRDEPRRY